jgi:hypothetical protein
VSHGNASTSCWAVHWAVGVSVTLTWTTRRRSCARTTKTNKTFSGTRSALIPDNTRLIPDNTRDGAPSSIAAVGLALSSYPVGVERGILPREDAVGRTLATLRFFRRSLQGTRPEATGYKGFYYHFLDMKTGRRAGRSELSTIDSAILLAGVLVAAGCFDGGGPREREIRETAELLYRRADWQWATNRGKSVAHGWSPEAGFLPYRWQGYNEALILYILGLGSPTYPLPEESYATWTATYTWKKLYGFELLYAGPLFIHQLSHLWIDFRGSRTRTCGDRPWTTSRTAAARPTSRPKAREQPTS